MTAVDAPIPEPIAVTEKVETTDAKLPDPPNTMSSDAQPVSETFVSERNDNPVVTPPPASVSTSESETADGPNAIVVANGDPVPVNETQRPHSGGFPPTHWRDHASGSTFSNHQRNRSAPHFGAATREGRTRVPHTIRPRLTEDALKKISRSLGGAGLRTRRESPAPSIASASALE